MPRYEVVGLGRETGRKRVRIYEARNKEDAIMMAASEGIVVDTSKIRILPESPATERQIEDAKDLDIKIPKGITKNELSKLINQAEDEDWPTKKTKQQAQKLGIKLPTGITNMALLDLIDDKGNNLNSNIKIKKTVNSLKERLRGYINYAIGRLDYYDNMGNKFSSFSLTFLIVLVPVLTFLINLGFSLDLIFIKLYLFPIILGLITFLFMSLSNIITYGKRSATEYPYRKVADVLWYYKYNVENVKKPTPKDFIKNLRQFTQKIACKDEIALLHDDIQQLIILYRLQNYKRTLSRILRNRIASGIYGLVFLIVLALFLSLSYNLGIYGSLSEYCFNYFLFCAYILIIISNIVIIFLKEIAAKS